MHLLWGYGDVVRCGMSIDIALLRALPALADRPRTEGGFRLFTPDTVKQAQFIKQAHGREVQ